MMVSQKYRVQAWSSILHPCDTQAGAKSGLVSKRSHGDLSEMSLVWCFSFYSAPESQIGAYLPDPEQSEQISESSHGDLFEMSLVWSFPFQMHQNLK